MTVYRDKRDARWRYRKTLTMPDGSKRRISGTPSINTKAAAETAEREHIARTLNPQPEQKEVLSFTQFVEDKWWPTYPKAAGNRHNTIREKESHLRLHLKPAFGELPLDRVRGEVVDRFFASLVEKGLSPKSRKNVRATLRRILASAAEWKYLEGVPHLPRIKVPDAKVDHFTLQESAELLAAARNDEERLLLMFALKTGARRGLRRPRRCIRSTLPPSIRSRPLRLRAGSGRVRLG